MNKAFLRDPEPGPPRCPGCGAIGPEVPAETLAAWLSPALRQRFGDRASFCSQPSCSITYFDELGGEVRREELPSPLRGKDLDAPLCGCTGLTRHQVEEDVAEGVVTQTKATVLYCQSSAAHCRRSMPSGQPCLSAVQGYYFKCQAEQGRRG
jgi:hypothetical protein